MNRVGIHALAWVNGWSRDDAERAITRAAALGFELIEIPALNLQSIDVQFTRRLLDEHDLECSVSVGLDAGTDISCDDSVRTTAGEAYLQRAVSVAAELRATHVCGILYSASQRYSVHSSDSGLRRAADVLRRVAAAAEESNITLALKAVNRYESNALNTAAQASTFVALIDATNVKVDLDTYHMNIEEADTEKAIADVGNRLGYFHVGESDRGYLGAGNVEFSRVFRALAAIAYEGPIVFEALSADALNAELAAHLGVWRTLWEDSSDLARHARDFIHVQLVAAREALARRSRP